MEAMPTDAKIAEIIEALREQGGLDQVIMHVGNYDGHWKGEAFVTFHTYGVQMHRTRDDAARWNVRRREARPVIGMTVSVAEFLIGTEVANHHDTNPRHNGSCILEHVAPTGNAIVNVYGVGRVETHVDRLSWTMAGRELIMWMGTANKL